MYLLPFLCAFTIQNPPHDVHLSVTFNGGPAGEVTYHSSDSGEFRTTVHLSIPGAVIEEKMTGHFKGARLSDFDLSKSGQGPAVSLRLKDGVLTGWAAGVAARKLPYDSKLTVYTGNLLPQFAASMLAQVDFAKKEPQTVRAFMVDAGKVVPLRITPLGEKALAVGSVRQYRLNANIVSVDYSVSSTGDVVGMDVPGQKLRLVADGWAALYEDPFVKHPELSQATFKVRKASTQHLKTRDGVVLVQDVILPDAPGPFPVVFTRTPYERSAEAASANFYVARGYAFVAQDVRGRGASGGDWDPMVNEMNDAYDTLDWISKQPWCDGNVGMIGASYDGFVQWAAAASGHPALKCIVPQVSPPLDAMHNLPYDHGIFFLYGDVWWAKIVRKGKTDMSTVLAALPHPDGFLKLPLSETAKAVLGTDVPFYHKWLERTGQGDWGEGWNFYDRLKDVSIPALNISGWWDGDEIGTNMNWARMHDLGRTNQWLIYGPWTHFFNTSSALGDTDFGTNGIIDLDTLYIRWFDTWLKHKEVGLDKVPHVQAFVTGANQWLKLPEWPSPYSTPKTLYLAANGSARGVKGGGRLAEAPLPLEVPSVIDYDPAKAEVPADFKLVDTSKVSTDATGALSKLGVLLFQSDPLAAPMAISGPYEVDLSFRTSARDTDFYAALMDVDEKGHARSFGTTGKIRCSYLQGYDRPRALTPGHIYVARIQPWDSAHELKIGHRLALVLSCDGFPEFARNLGTAEPIKNATRMVKQHNEIFHDAVHPSAIHFRVLW